MSDSEAQIYLDWFNSLEDNGVFASIATQAQKIAKDTTNQRMKAGLIPSDEMDAMNRFSYYVPLRGDISQDQEIDEDLADAIVPRTMGTFFGAKGRPDPTITKGRPYKDAAYAEHLIATLMSQNQKTIELLKVGLFRQTAPKTGATEQKLQYMIQTVLSQTCRSLSLQRSDSKILRSHLCLKRVKR